MFKSLTEKLNSVFDKLRSKGALTEADINDAMRQIRIALLEADVSIAVAKDFIANVKEKSLGAEVIRSVSPGQMVVKIVHDELISLLDAPIEEKELKFGASPPISYMIVGLQGSGKTTATAKLGLFLKTKKHKKTLLVSLDTYRPAAQKQLETLAKSIEVDSLEIIASEKPLEIVKRAKESATKGSYDVVIYDTAGRLHIDEEMMAELHQVKAQTNPIETILVADSLTGNDAVNIAQHFNEELDITGIILSRVDGDARGGAALSMRHVTGKPIKFLSTGEKPTALEEFDANRIASRILDMGDIVSFVEKAQETFNQEESEKLAKKMQSGRFDLNDLLSQLRSIEKMGGVTSILNMLPGMGSMQQKLDQSGFDPTTIKRQEAIILSMTKKERRYPDLLNASRKKRIAAGCGLEVQDVNKLLRNYEKMSKVIKRVSKMDKKTMMRSFGQLFS